MPETPVDAVFLSSTSIPVTGPATSGDRQYLTINLTVPRSEGGFTVTMSNAPIQLSSAVRSADNSTVESTGELGPLTISDSRYQSQPGWSVFGQIGDFTSGGHTFSGSYLGWTPVVTAQNAAHDVAAGPAVLPDSYPGLKGGSRLANAAAGKGLGATVLGAAIDLKAPASVLSRSASATITITVVEYAL